MHIHVHEEWIHVLHTTRKHWWVTKAYTVHVNCSGRYSQYKSGRCECISTSQGSKIVYSTYFMPQQTDVSGTYSFWFVCLSVCASHTKFCKHYSSKTMRRSILISTYVVPHISKLCTSLSACPSVCVLGQIDVWT